MVVDKLLGFSILAWFLFTVLSDRPQQFRSGAKPSDGTSAHQFTSTYMRKRAPAEDLPLDHPLLQRVHKDPTLPEQMFLSPFKASATGNELYYTVSYITLSSCDSVASWWEDTKDNDADATVASSGSYEVYNSVNKGGKYNRIKGMYNSGFIHRVVIGPLKANTRYQYTVGVTKDQKTQPLIIDYSPAFRGNKGNTRDSSTIGSPKNVNYAPDNIINQGPAVRSPTGVNLDVNEAIARRLDSSLLTQQSTSPHDQASAEKGKKWSFVTPKAPGADTYPLDVLVVGDLGQSKDSVTTMEHMVNKIKEKNIPLLLHAGDISYADGYHRRWDSYGKMAEVLHAQAPTLTTGGNHELWNGEAWVAYKKRFPMPFKQAGSISQLWYSYMVGPVHFVVLCSYAASGPGSAQYEWLKRDLERVDRKLTPWVVVNMHSPWYNSNQIHLNEEITLTMKKELEGMFHQHKVDLVFNGHVHAYERSFPVFEDKNTDCATTYVTIGDGGNREGIAKPWLSPQPKWSAFREGSFGFGLLTVTSPTEASWAWHRNQDGEAVVADNVQFTRCP